MRVLFLLYFIFLSTVSRSQIISTYAGNGVNGYSGDGGPAISARLAYPFGIAADAVGNLYIADTDNHVVRKVNAAGIISTFAGTGSFGNSGDGGLATSAKLDQPSHLAVDANGNVYIACNTRKIRKVSTTGIITTITGNLPAGYSGDGGPLAAAQFGMISGLTFDHANNLYISDYTYCVVRKVNSAGIISTFAGSGTYGFSGDGGLATFAKLAAPYAVLVKRNGDVYIPDAGNHRIRLVNSAGIISTYAGSGMAGYSGDGGPSNLASFRFPWFITKDTFENIYVSEAGNLVVRKIDTSGITTTYAGNGNWGYSGDGGPAVMASMTDLCGICTDSLNNLYLVNRSFPHVVRKVNNCKTAMISQQPSNVSLCRTGNANFGVIATNASGFQWQVNEGSGWKAVTDSNVYSGSTTSNLQITGASTSFHNFQYRCMVSNSCGPVFSTPAFLQVETLATPSIAISTPSFQICAGTSVVFSATVQQGGSSPIFQWKKNGLNVGVNSSTYISSLLSDGDVITCVLTSSSTCVTANSVLSNAVSIIVDTPSTPKITVTASINNVCFGTPVSFTTLVVNGGATPVYTWFKNGVNLFINSPVYSDNSLNNGDIIASSVTSSLSCVTRVSDTSSPINMSIIQPLSPTISITAPSNSICLGTPTTFTAAATNVGSQPTYQWRKNGLPVGTNSAVYTDNGLVNGDLMSCTLTSSATCLTSSQVVSNIITMLVHPKPVVSLDKSTGLCEGSNRVLDPGSFDSYLWNTGSTNRTISINQVGIYWVAVKDLNGCTGTDTTVINSMLPAPRNFLPSDTAICVYGDLSILPNSNFQSYTWSNGSVSHSINIAKSGQYWLKVVNKEGCIGLDTILVRSKDCLKGFFMPTAFTPNNDGRHDVIKPIILGKVIQYQFGVYNRWGNLIFQTSNLNQGWDGIYQGRIQDGNIFVWICSYQFENEPPQKSRGTFTLIR